MQNHRFLVRSSPTQDLYTALDSLTAQDCEVSIWFEADLEEKKFPNFRTSLETLKLQYPGLTFGLWASAKNLPSLRQFNWLAVLLRRDSDLKTVFITCPDRIPILKEFVLRSGLVLLNDLIPQCRKIALLPGQSLKNFARRLHFEEVTSNGVYSFSELGNEIILIPENYENPDDLHV